MDITTFVIGEDGEKRNAVAWGGRVVDSPSKGGFRDDLVCFNGHDNLRRRVSAEQTGLSWLWREHQAPVSRENRGGLRARL